jgi:hypothetical protein
MIALWWPLTTPVARRKGVGFGVLNKEGAPPIAKKFPPSVPLLLLIEMNTNEQSVSIAGSQWCSEQQRGNNNYPNSEYFLPGTGQADLSHPHLSGHEIAKNAAWVLLWKRMKDRRKSIPMLDQYISECMVIIININNCINEPTHGYQNCNTSQILIFGGYLKVKESLYTQVITWVNSILKHIDTMTILPKFLHGL